jgi:hypothetical protein
VEILAIREEEVVHYAWISIRRGTRFAWIRNDKYSLTVMTCMCRRWHVQPSVAVEEASNRADESFLNAVTLAATGSVAEASSHSSASLGRRRAYAGGSGENSGGRRCPEV